MNTQLVVQMAIEAGYTKDMFGDGHWDMQECKKFAELIIKKCIEIDIENPDARPGLEIANYFGIDFVDETLRNRSTYFGHNP